METLTPECVGGFGEQKSNGGKQFYQQERIYDGEKIATSLSADLPGGANYYTNRVHQIGYLGKTKSKRDNPERMRVYDPDGVCATIHTMGGGGLQPHIIVINKDFDHQHDPGLYVRIADDCVVYAVWYAKYECYVAIRKLTPRECFRLQGWTDDYFDKAAFVNSDCQLYKQAGNGVTVNVVYDIGCAINARLSEKDAR